jgi:hypothetical protein
MPKKTRKIEERTDVIKKRISKIKKKTEETEEEALTEAQIGCLIFRQPIFLYLKYCLEFSGFLGFHSTGEY